jgi:hypothetical protein
MLIGAECMVIWWLTAYHAEKMHGVEHRLAQQRLGANVSGIGNDDTVEW